MRTRYRKILVTAALTALALTAIFASAADAAPPAPPFEDFAGCPSVAEQSFIANCLKLNFTGGQIGFGNRVIPVTNPFALVGGYEQETGEFLFNSEGGITPAQQTVPGGLIGLTGYKWLDEAVEGSSALELNATIQLAGQPGSVNLPTRVLPIRIHLENQFLGEGCYVGSNEDPVVLNLTTGTTSPPPPNQPITGQPANPLQSEVERPAVSIATGGIDVDNAYAVPAASGCEFTYGSFHRNIDNLVNSRYGLPSPAGSNTTVLDFTRQIVSPEVVYP